MWAEHRSAISASGVMLSGCHRTIVTSSEPGKLTENGTQLPFGRLEEPTRALQTEYDETHGKRRNDGKVGIQ